MGGFERANSVMVAAAPTFSEFVHHAFRELAPQGVVRLVIDTESNAKDSWRLAANSVKKHLHESSSGSTDESEPTDAVSPKSEGDSLATIRNELHELRQVGRSVLVICVRSFGVM